MIGIILMLLGVAIWSTGWYKSRVIDAKGESFSKDWYFWTVIDWLGFLLVMMSILAL